MAIALGRHRPSLVHMHSWQWLHQGCPRRRHNCRIYSSTWIGMQFADWRSQHLARDHDSGYCGFPLSLSAGRHSCGDSIGSRWAVARSSIADHQDDKRHFLFAQPVSPGSDCGMVSHRHFSSNGRTSRRWARRDPYHTRCEDVFRS